ncbi:hypothetical protein FPZ12_023040 [Amycolatopsis acidicola]|uniref:Uncharacterized protein n=1 Tax=Amycolatopsis acidicola TaxID=2596893 RepID=A0A5N0UYY5_9PSEU|nr:hypothetical protein [Amycolatopsis acidicola]KAA9158222.1 hypothetical protein FPZ12_023040 [Amycolatopsis acidicola]
MLAATGIALVTVTACGQQPQSVPAAGGGATSAPPSSSAAPTKPGSSQSFPTGLLVVPPGQLDASALPADYPHEVYVTADGKTVYLRAEEGGCGKATVEVREETSSQVALNLIETKSNIKGQMCTMDIRYPVVSVPLSAPLGERKLVLSSEKRGG